MDGHHKILHGNLKIIAMSFLKYSIILTKHFLLFIMISHALIVYAQEKIPAYVNKKISLHIPAFLPGIMKDSFAILKNDTLQYKLNGQIFKNGIKIILQGESHTLRTPWETLYAMIDAYTKKNKKRIIDLYSSNSKEKIKELLNGNRSNEFLDFVSRAAKANLKILGGIQYQNGFMIYSKDDLFGIHENYIIKETDKYKLSVFDDNASTSWNIALYFKFDPKPMIPLKNIQIPDSLKLDDSVNIKINLPEPDRWVAIYFGSPGEPIKFLVQDNGINDFNLEKNVIDLHLKGATFFVKGNYTIYISSFNYPVQRISQNFFKEQSKYVIKIY